MSTRRVEAERAAAFVDGELDLFIRQLHRKSADDCIAALHTWAEAVRMRERDRALGRLGGADDKTREVIDDLTRVLTKKILTDATASIRACAEEGDRGAAEALVQALTRGTTGAVPPRKRRYNGVRSPTGAKKTGPEGFVQEPLRPDYFGDGKDRMVMERHF